MELALVLLPALAGVLGDKVHGADHAADGVALLFTLGLTLVKVAVFAALVLLLGPRLLPPLLKQVARTGSRELFTLAVLSIALGIAFGSAMLFGVSMALGAFFAGMVLNESTLSHKAASNSLPLQDAFAVLFFVSVGMLFDPAIVLREPLLLAGVLLLVLVGKSLVAMCIVLSLGYPMGTALTVSAALAQIGEFSFILAGIGVGLGLLPQDGFSMILAAALLSITLNPLVFAAVEPLGEWVRKRPRWREALEEARMPRFARLVRGQTLRVREEEFVTAARAVGVGDRSILAKHIFPNVTSPIIVQASLNCGFAIVTEASLSFLGLGGELSVPSWGSMLRTGYGYMEISPLLAVSPGLMIFLAVLSFNLLGDGLRDALDPRLNRLDSPS